MAIEHQIQQLQAAIAEDPENEEHWVMLGVCGVLAGQYRQTLSMFKQREELYGDGVEVQFATLAGNVIAENPHLQTRMAGKSPPEIATAFDAVTTFTIGAAKICLGDVAAGRDVLRRLNSLPAPVHDRLENLPQVQRSGKIVEMFMTADEIDGLLRRDPPAWSPLVEPVGGRMPTDVPFVIFTLADQAYFDRFGADFIQALKHIAPIHVHVINGEVSRLEEALRPHQGRVTASVEAFDGDNLAPYCASSRFLHVQKLMKSGAPDILCMDIDVAGIRDFDRYLARARSCDVSLFQDSSLVPWLRQWATSIYFSRSSEAMRYLETLCCMIRHQLKDIAWFFDQAALLSLYFWAQKHLREGTVSLLTTPDGYRLHDFITPSGGLKEKIALRQGDGLE